MFRSARNTRTSTRVGYIARSLGFQPRLTSLEDRLAPAIFEVGYGLAYASVGGVPWNALTAGDTVNIHWRTAAQGGDYHEKINISGQGTAANPIRVIGVAGPNGEKPVINGQNATTGANSTTGSVGHQTRGLITFSRGNGNQNLNTYKPQHIIVDGLVVTGAKPSNSFTNSAKSTVSYASNAAAVYIERGSNITIRNCTITDSGNGIFAGSNDYYADGGIIRDVLVEHNHIYGNGTAGGTYEHNIYTEGVNFTFQFNRLEGVRATSTGGNLKDRSAGTIIRYNYVSGAGRLDLVNAQESASVLTTLPQYRHTYVYGNVLHDPPGATGAMIHYGGDDEEFQNYRKGTLHFYHNTVIVRENQSTAANTYLFRVDTSDETVEARNNILYRGPATTGSTPTKLILADVSDSSGVFNFGANWVSSGWQAWAGNSAPAGGAMNGTANFLNNTANDPGFVNLSASDYHLLAAGQSIDKGQALDSTAASAQPLTRQYVYHQGWDDRTVFGAAADLGAFEFESGTGGNTAPTITDVVNQSSTGSAVGPLAFTVGDAQTAVGSLVVTRASSNTTLLPLANIVLAGTGANRTVLVTPAAGQTGSATVTLTVTDAGGLTATDTFVLTVSGGTLKIRKGVASVDEAAGTVTLLVPRTGSSVGAVTVQYATSNGTASAPGDYTATSGTLTWANGDTRSKKIVVPIINDVTVEGDETFFVTISNPTGGATLGNITKGTVTILANDGSGRWIEPPASPPSEPTAPLAGDTGSLMVVAPTRSSGGTLRRISPVYLAPTGEPTESAPVAETAESTMPEVTVWNLGAEDLSQSDTATVVVPSTVAVKATRSNPVDLEASLGQLDGVFVG